MHELIIFLDVDGVLLQRAGLEAVLNPVLQHITVTGSEITTFHEYLAEVRLFSIEALTNLNLLLTECESQNVKIVLSSNWRYVGDVELIKYVFGIYKFSDYIIDKTGVAANRGLEIANWLRDNPTRNYIVIDDVDHGIAKLHQKQFIHVDPQRLLSRNNVISAIKKIKDTQE